MVGECTGDVTFAMTFLMADMRRRRGVVSKSEAVVMEETRLVLGAQGYLEQAWKGVSRQEAAYQGGER